MTTDRRPRMEIRRVESDAEMQHALTVRRSVFIDEQRVPEEEEIDEYDLPDALGRTAVHVVGWLDGQPIATARLLINVPRGELPHIGRVAVLKEYRGRGFGRDIMEVLQEEALRRGFDGVTLAAQLHAVPFYEHLGYRAHGPIFLDAGIRHREMDLRWD